MSQERRLRIPATSPYTYLQSDSCVTSDFTAEIRGDLEDFKRDSDYVNGEGVYAGSKGHTSALAARMPGVLTLEKLRDWVEIGELPLIFEWENETRVVPLKVSFFYAM